MLRDRLFVLLLAAGFCVAGAILSQALRIGGDEAQDAARSVR